jgi:CRP-like cAMP-binding protein
MLGYEDDDLTEHAHGPRQNLLLAALPEKDFEYLSLYLEKVEVPLGFVMYESGMLVRHVYFPIDCIVSLLYVLEDGASAEIAVVGKEGVVGFALFMRGESTTNRAVVQCAGYAYRLKARWLKDGFMQAGGQRSGALLHLLLLYSQALMTQIAQTAVCNRHHSVEQQLCRCLLFSLDRLPSNELVMTHELIASLLGVRREGVTEAASKLKNAGLVTYHRGHIFVLDRPGLEARVCECYSVVKKEFERLFPAIRPLVR